MPLAVAMARASSPVRGSGGAWSMPFSSSTTPQRVSAASSLAVLAMRAPWASGSAPGGVAALK